jgi:YD repeat-containing protein
MLVILAGELLGAQARADITYSTYLGYGANAYVSSAQAACSLGAQGLTEWDGRCKKDDGTDSGTLYGYAGGIYNRWLALGHWGTKICLDGQVLQMLSNSTGMICVYPPPPPYIPPAVVPPSAPPTCSSSGAGSFPCLGGTPENAKTAARAQKCACAGDPVNTATGNKYDIIDDVVLAGPSPLGFTRYYNSIILSAPRGMLGAHWRSNLDRSLITIAADEPVFNNYPVTGNNTGCSPLSACTGANRSPAPDVGSARVFPVGTDPTAYKVLISTAEGNAYAFVWSGGAWHAQDGDVTGKLSYIVDSANNVLGWTYVNPQDETETYSPQGQLLTVTKRNGRQLYLFYQAPTGGQFSVGLLKIVSDNFGHELQLSYGSNGLLQTLVDPNFGTWTYAYDANDNLTGVTGPDNKTRSYLYEKTAFPNALTGVVDEKGVRIDTTDYDDYGRATSTVGWNGTNANTIIYSSDNSHSEQITPLGDHIYRTYTTVLGVPKLYQLSHSASGGAMTNNYYANGNLQSTELAPGIRTV